MTDEAMRTARRLMVFLSAWNANDPKVYAPQLVTSPSMCEAEIAMAIDTMTAILRVQASSAEQHWREMVAELKGAKELIEVSMRFRGAVYEALKGMPAYEHRNEDGAETDRVFAAITSVRTLLESSYAARDSAMAARDDWKSQAENFRRQRDEARAQVSEMIEQQRQVAAAKDTPEK